MRLRARTMTVLSLVLGLLASAVSGDWARSLGVLPEAVVAVWGLSLLVMTATVLWERHVLRLS